MAAHAPGGGSASINFKEVVVLACVRVCGVVGEAGWEGVKVISNVRGKMTPASCVL